MNDFSYTADDYAVKIYPVRGEDCGYPQCVYMWHMQFTRGGFNSSAFLPSRAGAEANAQRIVNQMRGTHDCFSNLNHAEELEMSIAFQEAGME